MHLATDGWARNGDVRLHYLEDGRRDSGLTPLLYVPGMSGKAEDFGSEFAQFEPRCCVAVSLRGRGRSDAPAAGYRFDDHVADVAAVVEQAGLTRLCLMAFSTGVAYALGYAVRHPERLAGLVVLDYPARYPKVKPDWAERVLEHPEWGWQPHVVWGLQQESAEVLLWQDLQRLRCPALILRGGQPGSLLRPEEAELYQAHLPGAQVVVFPDAGHEVWEPDHGRFVSTVGAFLAGVHRTPA